MDMAVTGTGATMAAMRHLTTGDRARATAKRSLTLSEHSALIGGIIASVFYVGVRPSRVSRAQQRRHFHTVPNFSDAAPEPNNHKSGG